MLGLLILKMSTSVSDPALVDFGVEDLVRQNVEDLETKSVEKLPQHTLSSTNDDGSVQDNVSDSKRDPDGRQQSCTESTAKKSDGSSCYSNLIPKHCIPSLVDEEFSHVRSVGIDENSFYRAVVFEWCRHVIEARNLDAKDREIIFNYVILSDAQLTELEDSTIAVREMVLWATILKECVISGNLKQLRGIFSAPSTDLFAVWICRQRICMILRDHLATPGLINGQKQMTLKTFLELKGENIAETIVDVVNLGTKPSHAALICASFAFLATINVTFGHCGANSDNGVGRSAKTVTCSGFGKSQTKTACGTLQKVIYVGTKDLYNAKIKERSKAVAPSSTKSPAPDKIQTALSKLQPFTLNLFSEDNKNVFRILYTAAELPAPTAVTAYSDSMILCRDLSMRESFVDKSVDGEGPTSKQKDEVAVDTFLVPHHGQSVNKKWDSMIVPPYDYESSLFQSNADDDAILEIIDDTVSDLSTDTMGSDDVGIHSAGNYVPNEINADLLCGTTLAGLDEYHDESPTSVRKPLILEKKKTPRIPSLDFLKPRRPTIPQIPSSSSSFTDNFSTLAGTGPVTDADVSLNRCNEFSTINLISPSRLTQVPSVISAWISKDNNESILEGTTATGRDETICTEDTRTEILSIAPVVDSTMAIASPVAADTHSNRKFLDDKMGKRDVGGVGLGLKLAVLIFVIFAAAVLMGIAMLDSKLANGGGGSVEQNINQSAETTIDSCVEKSINGNDYRETAETGNREAGSATSTVVVDASVAVSNVDVESSPGSADVSQVQKDEENSDDDFVDGDILKPADSVSQRIGDILSCCSRVAVCFTMVVGAVCASSVMCVLCNKKKEPTEREEIFLSIGGDLVSLDGEEPPTEHEEILSGDHFSSKI